MKQTRFRAYCWFGMVAFSSAVRRGVEIGRRNDACDEKSSGQTATSVDLSRCGLGEEGESGQADRLDRLDNV